MAQRLVQAKRKIRDAGVPYRVPAETELPNRLRAVMAVVYLVFNAGYSAADSHDLVRVELCVEAVPESVPEPDRPDPVFGTGRETVRAGRMLSVVVVPETTESGTGIRAWGGRAAPLSALPGLPPGSASRSIRDLSAQAPSSSVVPSGSRPHVLS